MNRILNVVRMQLLTKMTFLWIPLIILTSTFLFTLAIFALIPSGEMKYGGGIQAPLWYLLAMGIQAVSLTFPFSQAMSVTRREFYLGTMLMGTLAVTALSVIVLVGGLIEDATDGWGVNGLFFRVALPLWDQSPMLAMLVFFTAGLFLFVMGFLFATVYRRWGTIAVVSAGVGLGVALLAAVAVLTKFELWGAVAEFFIGLGPWGTLGLGFVITVLVGAASYAPLRRSVA